ncbi:hypothetical protein BDV25DRAFT_71554 [Aspergillus avenaceus]|uniref:Uncharacterized protein n=1 Tax=Aspergillus avenaceus TaxID=36643 RepID=A0A5N6TGM0_ASPAV|nr:hypothetical protein BDV25DRAFT_71554 [Aspergillus avenaceus]
MGVRMVGEYRASLGLLLLCHFTFSYDSALLSSLGRDVSFGIYFFLFFSFLNLSLFLSLLCIGLCSLSFKHTSYPVQSIQFGVQSGAFGTFDQTVVALVICLFPVTDSLFPSCSIVSGSMGSASVVCLTFLSTQVT